MEVLVVDDDPLSRRLIATTLSGEGYKVTTACNGVDALKILTRQRHQLVVSDCGMPQMDGNGLCRAVRDGDLRRYVYFIMVTSHNRPIDEISSFAAGVDDYICKPFNPNELLMRVNVGRRIIQLESSHMTIFALAKLAESRDPETGEHLERVRSYCRVLARQLAKTPAYKDIIDSHFINLIYLTSPLHDIGKVAIPDHILLKPGKLTKDEFDLMKTHTVRGAATIASMLSEFPSADYLRMARDLIQHHHEKFDGSGYPNGLAGKAIPLSARIMAVADVYDALTSKRVYKEASSHEEAMTIMTAEAGAHFDPAVVNALVAAEPQFREIRAAYSPECPLQRSTEIPSAIRPSLSAPHIRDAGTLTPAAHSGGYRV